MNLAHIHLLLNHFPTIGFIIGLGLYLIALAGKSDDLKRASMVVFMGIALITIPTYVSGNAAEQLLDGQTGVAKDVIRTHESAALGALGLMELTGAVAWLGLWQFRRKAVFPRPTQVAVLVLAIATLGIVSRAANIGGGIRHPEILSPGETIIVDNTAREIGAFVVGARWMWPTCETLHFVGLCLILGVVFLLDLRMLGVMKNVPFVSVHRLLPWGILGFGINVATGMLFFVGAPDQYDLNTTFHWKLVFVLLAGANALYFTVLDDAWSLKAGEDAPATAKFAAASALALWFGVMYCGTMLPFLGNAF